ECVSNGAAIQAGIIKGDVKDVLLLDVTPLSLGIETLGGVCTKLIERNTTVPTKKSQTFSTAENNQTAVTIRVLQGERGMANDNTELGRFDLVDIPPAPRGVPKIEVTFDIDANAMVHVTAKDLGTGKEQSIRITAPNKLSEEDIDRMVKEAELHSEDDKKRKEMVETKNQADMLIFSTEKAVKDYGDKVSEAEKKTIEEKLNNLKDLVKQDSPTKEALDKAMEELSQSAHKLAEEVYKASNAQAQGQSGPQAGAQSEEPAGQGEQNQAAGSSESDSKGSSNGDDVIDAEYKE
ncbi:MAG: Hsp70 family protein, partial [Candidatus Omnitrophica bacterium]|nr:Hsp70 family protein [Candidatus Omnitrophota bacterium]